MGAFAVLTLAACSSSPSRDGSASTAEAEAVSDASGYVPALTCAVVDPALVAEVFALPGVTVEQAGNTCIYSASGGLVDEVWIEIRTPVGDAGARSVLPEGEPVEVDDAGATVLIGSGPLALRAVGQIKGSLVVVDGKSTTFEGEELEQALLGVMHEALPHLPDVEPTDSDTPHPWCDRLGSDSVDGFPSFSLTQRGDGCDLVMDEGGLLTIAVAQQDGAGPVGLAHVAEIAGDRAEPNLLDGAAVWVGPDEERVDGQLYVVDGESLIQVTVQLSGADGDQLKEVALTLVTGLRLV